MGCVHSVDKEEAVIRCRDRRRLMKQLLSRRAGLAAAHMAYLQSLRNIGATLRQFTEVDSAIPGADPQLPPSPPPPPPPPTLPPSPPPPPPLSPELRNTQAGEEITIEDLADMDDEDGDECCTPPPPPLLGSAWDFWDPFSPAPASNSFSPLQQKKNGGALKDAGPEEENWVDTNTEFGDEEEAKWEGEANLGDANVAVSVCQYVECSTPKGKSPTREALDDNSSAVSWVTKDTDMAVVVWRSKKTLAGIVMELDDYFLKAAEGGKDVALMLESNRSHRLHWDFEENKGKNSKSAKVFHALSWSWSSRSLQCSRDACFQDPTNSCRPVNHCTTLEKIYAKEQRLYKEVKDEEIAKFQHQRKTILLNKLEASGSERTKAEKTQLEIEELQFRIISLQETINEACLSISKLRDEELCPQLVELSSGLVQMWRTMYEYHQVQDHIVQQVNLLDNHPGTEPTTDSHRLATSQLEAEATSWHTSFCNLLTSQREYVHILNQWVKLTDCLPNSNRLMTSTSGVHELCEKWQRTLERLPDKVAAEAIKTFVSVIHSIVLQQTEECNLQKKFLRLESRLDRELSVLSELEKRDQSAVGVSDQVQGTNHLKLAAKHAKLDAFRKRVEEEKSKYLNSVLVSRAMTVNHLKTSLPNVFQALMGFASVCIQAFEGLHALEESNVCQPEGNLSMPTEENSSPISDSSMTRHL